MAGVSSRTPASAGRRRSAKSAVATKAGRVSGPKPGSRARATKPGRGRRRAAEIGFVLCTLKLAYPGARCSLDYRTPFELLVATILSAQCTDERVNLVTPEVFQRWPDARAMADADPPEVEEVIRSTGFFRSKTRALTEMARDLVTRHGGEPPADLEALTALRGVGRKTANVVLGNAYGIAAGVVVDTHVGRVARRLGLTRQADPAKAERDLMKVVPRDEWTLFSHLLIHHGRAICQARKPRCSVCPLNTQCPRVGVKVSA